MADQKVTDHSLLQLEGELSTRFDSVKGQLKQLQATIDSLEGAWKGIGAGAFNAKQTEINEHMVHIAQLLLNYQEAIKAARTISGNTEDEVRAALQGVDVVSGYSGDAGATAATSNLNNF
ncbi:WXG100 family type VII secretion target [Streptomyces sp. DT24]|uniref:WXG100 family type VII secretion target n=1 Tax=unclassified Streptomyces TaxID=2593676 RepID=UPI0023BA355B|nr:WXG100 family type VII secretion target [Streptomyces sp. AM 4-1-1]WEH36191.1 WXG100 family type VII secretion target [Streptomyces sp. AM 4-1-1]